MLRSSTIGQHPWTVEERWMMSDMLPMTTAQIGNPVATLVLMVTNDGLPHEANSLSVQSLSSDNGYHTTSSGTLVMTVQCHHYRFSNGNSCR